MARKYNRDNRGRFAGGGGGATSRGGRLKTASGKKRATQTMESAAKPKGTIGKPKGLKPGAITAKPAAKATTRLQRTGQTIKIAKKKLPMPTKEDKNIEKIKSLKVGQAAFGTGKSTATFIPDSALTSQRRKTLGLSTFANRVESQRWSVSRQSMGGNSGVLISERSAYKASLPKTRQGVIAKRSAAKPTAKPARAAANPAAKLKAPGKRAVAAQSQADKTLRVTKRLNNVTNAASTKTGVKRMNATEVGVRAKSFLTRKVGGMSGLEGKSLQQQQSIVGAAMKKPTRYSTQTPNRNKPSKFNSLGQSKTRAADALANRTGQERIAAARAKTPAPPLIWRQPRESRLPGRRELIGYNMGSGSAKITIKAPRSASTVTNSAAKAARIASTKPNPNVARTRPQSIKAQRARNSNMLNQTRTGSIGMGVMRKNPRIRKHQTGMSQLSLVGKPKPLLRFKPVKPRR